MQRVRNNFHKARKHTQKISREVRNMRKQWRRDCATITFEELPLATRRAMEEVRRYKEFLQAWEKSLEDNPLEGDTID
ncbi:MAG: hypothetical protein IJQ08_02045 [Synergistaceae bacterium]|nr:hypothetical protein [Synergistaceae bacterium]